MDSEFYLTLYLDSNEDLPLNSINIGEIPEEFPILNKSKLFYYINRLTNIHRLCIPPFVVLDILSITHRESHSGFSCCYEIITRLWYIHGLIKLFYAFIKYCHLCLALQTRYHTPYGLLQPIESSPVMFFTLTLDFVLALFLLKKKYNAIMSIICKFSK